MEQRNMNKNPNIEKGSPVVAVIMIVIGVAMAIASWFILPDQVAMQLEALDTGVPDMPKIVAVLFPLAITTIFSIYSINYKKQGYIALVGYGMNLLFWLTNM